MEAIDTTDTQAILDVRRADKDARSILTDRQYEVAKLLMTEATYKEIASTLKISLKTVEIHIDEIYRRLNVRGSVGVVVWLMGGMPHRERRPKRKQVQEQMDKRKMARKARKAAK